jgi:hypothetical protein
LFSKTGNAAKPNQKYEILEDEMHPRILKVAAVVFQL